MTPRLQPAGPDASELLAALHRQCFVRGWSAKEFDSFFDHNDMVVFIACDGELPVGFSFSWVVAGQCEILAIGVLEQARAKGIARLMLDETLRQAYSKDALTAFLEVGTDNVAALALYRRAGFETIGVRKGYYSLPDGSVQDAFSMRCELKG